MERLKEFFEEMKERFFEFKEKYETSDIVSLEKNMNNVEVIFRWISYLLWLFIFISFPIIQVRITGNWLWWFSYLISPVIGFIGFIIVGMLNVLTEDFYMWFRTKRRK